MAEIMPIEIPLWAELAAVSDAAIASVVLTTVIRLLALRFGWSFPEQHALTGAAPRLTGRRDR